MSRHLALQLAYQGTDFHGYQVQPQQRTVQSELEHALERLLGHCPQTICAGRTDAGVHAYAQVVHFSTDHSLPLERLGLALNALLPGDLRVVRCFDVPPDFSARFSAVARHYRYLIGQHPVVPPLLRQHSWFYSRELDSILLQQNWESLQGRHNFAAFCKTGSYRENFEIPIHWVRCWPYGSFWVLEIIGQSFLYNMVRTLVGTVVDIARGHLSPEVLPRALEGGERRWVGTTAPPQGLYLYNVIYPPDLGLNLIQADLHDWPVPLAPPQGPRF